MTSTNDGKDVKSNYISGPKSKTYFIELYKSLDARLSGECSGEERTRLVCQSWRRVHSLCQHSAPETQLHLINWLQQHTANTILQTEWQSPKSKEQQAWLKQAIDEFIQECQNAISKRDGGWSPPWEHQLQLRALWFRSTLPNPWGHSVLKALLASKGTQPGDDAVLEWLKLERGVMFVTRLRQLAASKCDDLALLLATAVMDKFRAATVIVSDVDQAEAKEKPELLNDGESSTFAKILKEEAGFTEEVWTLITDIEFVLSYKGELRSRCIELAKRTPLRDGSRLAGRLHGRLERSPRDRKLWKNAREAATLVAEVVVARCMVVPRCVGAARRALGECAGLLALLLAPARLRAAAAALAAPAATSRHLYTLAEAVHERYKDEKTPFVCELYVRAITAGVNELERLKIKTDKESEARATEKTLSGWFSKLGGLLSASRRLYCECILTAFSVHPSAAMYDRVKAAPALAPLKTDIQETNEEANSEYGSWATDSRTQTNFVKTSETLKLKKTQGRANVLSTAIFAEGEALGLGADLCQDLAVLISGPRIKTLSWDTDRRQLLAGCVAQVERTRGGTHAPDTQLRYLHLDHRRYRHLPEEPDGDGDLYYGIEKGYEHLVDIQEPEEIWPETTSDNDDDNDNDNDNDGGDSDGNSAEAAPAVARRKINKTKRLKYSSDEDSESPGSGAVAKSRETKDRPRGGEREEERKEKKHKTKVKRETNDESVEIIEGSEKRTKKKERKERKKKDTSAKPIARPGGSLSRLVGMKVAGLSILNSNLDRRSDGNVCVTDSDYDSQGKSSIASLNSEGNDPDVLFDGLFSMEDIKSPEKSVHDNIQRANMSKMDELSLSSGTAVKYHRNLQSSSYQTPLPSSNVNHVREDVKNSIKKLIEFRRFKNNNDDLLIKTDVNTQRPMYEQQSSQNNIPVLNTQSVSNIPKVFIHKEQIKQLNALKHEVNNILQKTSFSRDKSSCDEAPEKLISPNTITKRPKERPKKTSYKSSASKKVEQQLKLNNSMSIINQQGLLETTERTTESNQNKHQELIKHLEKGSSKINLKTMHSSRPRQFLEKSETTNQNIYQSIPQHISNTSPSLLHTKVINTDEITQGSHNLHQCSSKTSQLQHRPITQKHDPRQQQIHSFLKDLQVSINAGASSDKHESKVSSTQTCLKQTIQQKKSDNVPHTFARMNYLKNKQTDLKLKSMDKTIQNKCIYGTSIDSLQHLHSNREIFISKIDKRKAPVCKEKDKIKIENQENKPKVKIEMIDVNTQYKPSTTPLNIVKKHPTVSNMLLSGSQKHVPTSSANDLNCIATMPLALTPERTSFLSEKDQDDMLHLLRQQSLLNSIKGQHKTDIPKSSVENITLSNNTTPLIVNPDRRQSINASNIKIHNTIPEPKNTNEKPLATAVLKVSNTKPPSASHSKKRNAKEMDKSTKDVLKNSDWESVMNALLATKTPTRMSQSGPNALDIALNKDSFERCYSSKPILQNQKKIIPSVITETNKSKPAIYIQKPVSDIIENKKSASIKKCAIKTNDKELSGSSKPQTNTRPLPVSKPVPKSKPIFIEKHLDLSKKQTFHKPGKPLPSVIQNRNDPFISGIKKSDYDLLDELMDEDLRQEIGELSDEEPYNVPLPNTTKYKNISNPSNMLNKNNSALNKSLYVHQQQNSEPFENTSKLTDSIYRAPVRYQEVLKPVVQDKKCTLSTNNSDKKLRIISNEVISPGNLVNNNINYFPVINNTAAAVRDSNESKHNFNLTPKKNSVCVSHHITPTIINPDATVTIDAQTRNHNSNIVQNSRFNILDPATVVLTVPPRNTQSNVMLIGNEFIYDPISTIQLDQANLTRSASNYNHNTYTSVNPAPKVTVYQTTQFATPVVNPVLVENPIVLPIAKSTNNVVPEVSQLTTSSIAHGGIRDNKISTNKLKSDIKNEMPVIEEIISQPTNTKLIDKDNANHSVPECDKLKVSKATSSEISRKPQKHNTCIADKNKISVSRIPICVTVSSNNDDTINSSHLGSQMNTETSLMCPQQIITDSPSQKSITVKTVKEDTVAPKQCPGKDFIEETDLKNSRIEDVYKQSKSTNQHHDRLAQKRLRILKREVEHRSHDKPIALSYEPIKPKRLTEVDNLQIENLLHVPSIVSKDIELPKPTGRRILLRSSNSLKVMKMHETGTLISNGKSKLTGVKIGKAKVKHRSKAFSKLCKTVFPNSNTAAKTTETCHMKQQNFNSAQEPISEEIAKSTDEIQETEKLYIINNENENKIDSHNTDSLEDSMESSVIPASIIKETEIPLKKEETPESKTQDRQLDSFTEYNAKHATKIPAVTLKNIEDSTDLAANTLQSELNEMKSISIKDQICNNNNNVSKSLSDESINDKNKKIREEFKDKIIFENLPNLDNDQSKRYIRIKVPNGSFKATISGELNVNIDSILEDPSIKSMLWEKMNCNTKCILNIKQIAVQSKNCPSIIKTHIQDVSYVIKDDVETINLISDDDEELTQKFQTEFGSFNIAKMDSNIFTKHQRKFFQRCEVRIVRSKLKKTKVFDLLEQNTTNSIIPVENICDISLTTPIKIEDYIEIDDSSNESVNVLSTVESTITKDSAVEAKLNGNVSNLNNKIFHDFVSDNIDRNIKENELGLLNTKMSETCESLENISEFVIKDCSLKIEKCDQLIKQYEQMKIKNNKCFVNLVRCDSSQCYRKKAEENFNLLEESSQLLDVFNVDEELSEMSEQSLKRVDSFSILNDLSSSDQDVSRASPSVIAEFDGFTNLMENTNTFSDINLVIDFLPLNCFGDWFMTKSKIRGIGSDPNERKFISFGIAKTYVTSDDLSTDCDSDRESNPASEENFYEECSSEKERNIYQAPSLLKIMVDFFDNNIHIIESLKPTKKSCKLQRVSRSPSLKRKLNDFKDNKNRTKISKMENQSTLLDSDYKLIELVTKEANNTVTFHENKPESLNNICRLYIANIYNRHEVNSAAFTMKCDKQVERNEANIESSLLICDIKKHNTTALESFKPLKSVIEEAIEKNRANYNENNILCDKINMKGLDCHIKQDEKLECVEQDIDLDITKSLANEASVLECKNGSIKNYKPIDACVELRSVSNCIENVVENINYVNKIKNTLENCSEEEDKNMKSFCSDKIVISSLNSDNEKSTLDININSLSSSTKDDNVDIDKNNGTITQDGVVHKNTSDESIVDVPLQDFNSDHSSEILIHSYTNNINFKIDKNDDSQNVNDDLLSIQKERCNSLLTTPTLEYSLDGNFYEKSHRNKVDKDKKEDNVDNDLSRGVQFHSPLVPENDHLLSNTENNESVILTVDIEKKENHSAAVILPVECVKNIIANQSKIDINIDYPCSPENSILLSGIEENAIIIKSLDLETERIKDEVELSGFLEKIETETIIDPLSECDETLDKNSKVIILSEDVKEINNIHDDKFKENKIFNSLCSSSEIIDLPYKEDSNEIDSSDLLIKQFKGDEIEKVIAFEEIVSPMDYEDIFDKTSCDQSYETQVEIKIPCLDENRNKEKDNISVTSPEETLNSVKVKPVPLLENPEIIMDSVENIKISETFKNEQYDVNISENLEMINNNSDIDLEKNNTTDDDLGKQLNSGNAYISNKIIPNDITVNLKLHSEQTNNKYLCNEFTPSVTYENNNIVNKKEALLEIASLGMETNSIISKNDLMKKEESYLSEINKVDLNQQHISEVLNENDDYNKSVKYENNISSDKSKQKNVTLVYKGDSRVVLEGSIYEDPVVGTCYVFPILNKALFPEDILSNVSNDKSISVLQQLKNKVIEDKFNDDNKIDDEWVNFNALPKITYLRGRLKDDDMNDPSVKKNKRNLKRKIDFNDKQCGKKYRKGKNIDHPKLTATAINDLGYGREYKRFFDYCNSITFSYSRPFHIEHIDVSDLLKSWPIKGIMVDNTDQTDFKNVLFIDEDIYPVPYDPLQQTFSEEISNCNDQQYTCSNIIENNFSMGFGEGSDRVIHISKDDEDNISKFSAATLSDVKQSQPFLMSNHHETDMRRAQEPKPYKEQKEVFKRYLTYIQLKEKVRSFFQNTTLELNKTWLTDNKVKSNTNNFQNRFPYELTCPDYIRPVPFQCVVQVVQVGQLPVSAAQNPVTCDPRVTQVTDASPSQCSGENSPNDSQSPIKTEYTELTTADISLPLVQEYERHIEAQESSKALVSLDNIPVETEIKTEIKDEIPDFENDQNDCNENNVLQTLVNKHINNIEYSYESTDCSESLHTHANSETIYEQEIYKNCDFIPEQKQHNSPEKTDQIAHAMNAAGITTSSEGMCKSRMSVNVMSQNISQEVANNDPPSPNNISKTTINSMTLQQALAQILPPPLNPTSQETNQSSTNSPLTSQVLHIVQGKNSNGNQLTLVDNSQNSVISNSNTPMLHIVQNKGSHTNSTSNTNAGQHTNSFGGLSLVESGLQQGNNQLLHIVNTGSQKNSTTGQLLKRVNLLTNLTNTQGSNEQKMVQFVCKSADGKSIQLNAPHQRSMVLRLQPIESNIQNNPKPTDCQELSPTSNGNNSSPIKEAANTQHEIKSRSVYEENYAKFIQSSNKSVPEKSTTLPKFNQAFGKQVFQDNNQKANDLNSNNSSHLSINSSTESSECQGPDNSINIDHIGQISSPPLLLRKSPAQTSQAQTNLVQQIKQTIAPMNIQTMHGGVIYTRQIPVNIGGGQTINLITVPSTELLDNDNQKPQGEVKFINQNDIESPIIKIVPHGPNNSNVDGSTDDSNNHIGITNENGQSTPTQHQPVLTQMRIKLPMLSKTPQMVSGTRVVRPSFFQIQRNVIGGANQPVYQQLVLTAAPPLSQHIRLPQTQTTRQVKVSPEGQSSSESQMSTSTLEQLREFDMVLEQVKERSTVQPNTIPNNAFAKLHGSASDTTDGSSVTSTVTESTQQVLYSIGNNQSLNVAYVNRKPNPTFVRSPDSSGIIDSPSSSTQIPHTVTSESTSNDVSTQPSQPKAAKVGAKSKSRPKSSSNSSNSMKINAVPPKTSTQKPLEDEQTTQRILYILAEYKEQVENSPDKDKPAPRRRSNPPSNPGSSKRKKSSSGSRRSGMRDMSPVHGEDTCRTMGSEDSSCGTSQGDCNDSCMDSHSPQDSPRKVVRKLTFDSEAITPSQPRPQPQRNVIVADGQTITVARGTSGKPTTAVLMPANYILPVSMVKGGQQIAIVTNRGPKILTVGGGEGGTTNALLLQRLIGPAGLKPVLTRPGVRHVRLPTAALHNLQAFNLATATFQPPDSTASPVPGSNPPELIETRASSSPWTDRDSQEVKPERGSSPEDTEPWNLPSSADPHDYSYEETVRTDSMDRTVLDAIPDRYSPDMEAQRIFDKMFDVDSKRSYIIDSQDDSRCAYDIDASDCDDKAYHQVVQRRDGSRHHRFAHVTHAAAMRHKYAILEHELRLQGSIFSQKSLSEECEDLGVDSPSASELFPEAELLFGNSPAHDAQQHSHTPQPTVLSQCGIPQPDIDDQIATDHLLRHEGLDDQQDLGVTLGLDEGIVTVSEDGMQATIALDQEEFARSHPNTTFHSEPTEDGEIQPFIMAGLKGRHITSTVFHATRAPATVLVSAPPPPEPPPSAHATQVIRRVCWDGRDGRFSVDAGDDAKTSAEDGSREAAPESPPGDDGASSPERHAELFWESNSTSERSEGRRPADFSSDSEKCCKSPSCDETNSTDSSGAGAHVRLDSVIKDARGVERSASADGSSADDAPPPVRTYPPKRTHRSRDADAERSLTGKTRAGERALRRRASARGLVKRGCHCCGGEPAPQRPKKPRQRKPAAEFASN